MNKPDKRNKFDMNNAIQWVNRKLRRKLKFKNKFNQIDKKQLNKDEKVRNKIAKRKRYLTRKGKKYGFDRLAETEKRYLQNH